jgi:hypothetical protein
LPVASKLDEEALEQAVEVDINAGAHPPLVVRCLSAEHIVAIAVKLGRLKDLARVHAFLDEDAVDLIALKDILKRHDLMRAWLTFCSKAGIEDPLPTT